MPQLDLDDVVWHPAPKKTEYGADMFIADIAITKDETLTIFTTKEGVALLKSEASPFGKDLEDYAKPLMMLEKALKGISDDCLYKRHKEAKIRVESMSLEMFKLSYYLAKQIESENG